MSFHFRPCRLLYKLHISYHNNISYCSEFLGMNITENLKWHIHISSLCASLSKVYYIIKSLKDVMSFNMIWTIYYAYFELWMKYSIIFWGRDRDSVKVLIYRKKLFTSFLVCILVIHVDIILWNTKFWLWLHFVCWRFCVLYKNNQRKFHHNFHIHGYNTRGKIDLRT